MTKQDVIDFRWLIVTVLRYGKRKNNRHHLEVAGQVVKVTPVTTHAHDASKLYSSFHVTTSACLFEGWVTLKIPHGLIPRPLTHLTRFDGHKERIKVGTLIPYSSVDLAVLTLPMYHETRAEQEMFTSVKLTQDDFRVVEYWLSLYGVNADEPVIRNGIDEHGLLAFRSSFTAARLLHPQDL